MVLFVSFRTASRQKRRNKRKGKKDWHRLSLSLFPKKKLLTGSGVLEHPLRDADGVLGGSSGDVLDVRLVGELLRKGRERCFFPDKGVEARKKTREERDRSIGETSPAETFLQLPQQFFLLVAQKYNFSP